MSGRTIAKLCTWENRKAKGRKQRNEQRAQVIFYHTAERQPPTNNHLPTMAGRKFQKLILPDFIASPVPSILPSG